MNDHDRLLKLCKDVEYLIVRVDNHLKHHWALTLALIGIAGSLTVKMFFL